MFRRAVLLVCIALLCVSTQARAESPLRDPVNENFFPPDMLFRHASEIGLDEQQKKAIESQVRENGRRFFEMQQNLQRQVAALADMLRRERPDEQEALAQLDKVLAAERDIKRVQLSLSLEIRSQLTPEQQAKAKELRQKYFAEMRSRQGSEPIRAKMHQLQERIRQMQDEGHDPSAAVHAVQEFKRLMQDGKPDEAEAALDRVLGELQANEKK
jgi:Spy/CpxP family protein refolding chaperone